MLEDEGFVVREAGNGKEALALIEQLPPSLILLDLMMPVMNGWEFCAQLRSQSAWASIPIIVLSAHGKVASTARELGAAGYIAKPFELNEFLRLVYRSLSAA